MQSVTTSAAPSKRSTPFEVNGRRYHPPRRPLVVICIDGCADEYLTVSIGAGRMPHLACMTTGGYRGFARAAMPTFTNVNNAAIVTGMPPSVTGIAGNFFLDPQTGKQVMMNSVSYLRCPTILAAAARAGRKVAMVTAKQKLTDILSHNMEGIAFSAEKADEADLTRFGIDDVPAFVGQPLPKIYSGDASVFVLRAGAALLRQQKADFMYLSLTDYMQHKYPPEADESLNFYSELDEQIGRLIEMGAIVAITADHGMNAKSKRDGSPNVIYLQSFLDQHCPEVGSEVVCPITDPYVVHHGALGSLVMVHLKDLSRISEVAAMILDIEGITEVYDRKTAAKKMQLPADRIGDLVVMCGRDVALGRTERDHDLSLLNGKLRTHGGRYEEMVPLVISEALTPQYITLAQGDPRNFDVFDFVCNGVAI